MNLIFFVIFITHLYSHIFKASCIRYAVRIHISRSLQAVKLTILPLTVHLYRCGKHIRNLNLHVNLPVVQYSFVGARHLDPSGYASAYLPTRGEGSLGSIRTPQPCPGQSPGRKWVLVQFVFEKKTNLVMTNLIFFF